jgi:hypothetical protein
MNERTIGSGDGASLSIETLLGEHGEGMCRSRLWKRVSLFVGAPVGNLRGGGVHLLGILRDS